MPVEHQHTIKAGTTRKLIFCFATDSATPARAKTGLASHVSQAVVAFVREGEATVHRVPLTPGRVGEWSPGSFAEVDAELMPGVYQLGAPDEMLAAGSTRAMLCVRFPGACITPVEISLVAYDPQDESRLGMTALGPEGRIAALRGAFPRLTARELDEQRASAEDS